MRVKAMAGGLLCVLCLALSPAAIPAQANRALISEEALKTNETPGNFIPPPEGQIEGACGIAVSPGGNLYVSDYYHRVVDVFDPTGAYTSQFGIKSLLDPDGVCQLAFDSSGNLYANEWHESVRRLLPGQATFDTAESTGVAVDSAGNVYVNDRTYVAVYEPSGEPVTKAGQPLRIGLGSLGDAYGLAVSNGKVYVPDAADDTVKVYEPAIDALDPAAVISHGFVSLADASVAVDPTNGHLLVVDNTQPLYEHPKAAVYEFDASGAFLSRLPGAPIDGEPSGITADPVSGALFVTSGNTERSNAFAYGPYTSSGSLAAPPPVAETPAPGPGGFGAQAAGFSGPRAARRSDSSASDIIQRGPVRVSFDGKLTPHALPRHGTAPVGIAVEAKIAATGGGTPPQLRRITIAINRNGYFTTQGLPVCHLHEIQPSTTAGALATCGAALVGEGRFSANVKLPEQSPFPSSGKILVFNARLKGRPAIFAHIYGTQPAPTSNVLPFLIKGSRGTYGTVLEASLPEATGDWGYVTGLRMSLRRRFSYRGKARSYLSAGCPAPAGFPGAVFPLARTSFDFAGDLTVVSVLSRSCKATG